MILLLLLSSIISPFAFAEHTHEKKSWGRELYRELRDVIHEYSYYGNKYNDGSYFPAEREQKILSHIEDTYLKNKPYQTYYSDDNPLQYVASIPMAKLLLYYGGDPIGKHPAYIPLNNVVTQSFPHKTIVPDLSHDEILAIIGADLDEKPWQGHLPSNNAIALAKLYLGLGADIHAPSGTDAALDNSRILISTYGSYGDTVSKYIVPDDKDFVNDRELLPYDEDHVFYRSPVTYWLEEFIAAGYPASMLDTHKLHYPHFMKDASVAQVTEMLENPDAHKIPTNINCPYRAVRGAVSYITEEEYHKAAFSTAEAEELCPLTPSVNMRDAMGRTPLHIAGEQGNKAVFDHLITIGADSTIKDYRGLLPKI